MNLEELTLLWHQQNQKLEQILVLNKEKARGLASLRIRGVLASMRPLKVFALIVGLIWVVFLDGFLMSSYNHLSVYFFWSGVAQSLITKIAIGIYLYQLLLLSAIDGGNPVHEVQQKVATLTLSSLWVGRILILQLPLWTLFWWNDTALAQMTVVEKFTSGSITLFFAYAAVWMSWNMKIENAEKRWFKWFFSGREWEPLYKAKQILDEVEGKQ